MVSDESPTRGYRSLGRFQLSADAAEFSFPAATSKYLKVGLASRWDESKPVELRRIRVGPDNVLARDAGGALVAAQPPMKIQKRLFHIVMSMGIAFGGLTFLMAILFPLTEEKMKEVRLKLDERHLAKAVAGEPTDEVAEEFVQEHPKEAGDSPKDPPPNQKPTPPPPPPQKKKRKKKKKKKKTNPTQKRHPPHPKNNQKTPQPKKKNPPPSINFFARFTTCPSKGAPANG